VSLTHGGQYALVRITIDLPDDLHRALESRAASSGVTVRDLACRLLAEGLRQPGAPAGVGAGRRRPPPVIVPPTGTPIPAVSRAQLRLGEE
jgi:plasmid stability protein